MSFANVEQNQLIEFWVEAKQLGAGFDPRNEMVGYLRCHSKFSPAMNELVSLIDSNSAAEGRRVAPST